MVWRSLLLLGSVISSVLGADSPATPTLKPELASRIKIFENVLPSSILDRLPSDVLAVSQYEAALSTHQQGKRTTRWLPRGQAPRTAIEAAIQYFVDAVRPNSNHAGYEWWTQVIESSETMHFHIDKDESIASNQQYLVVPEWSSVFYVTEQGGGWSLRVRFDHIHATCKHRYSDHRSMESIWI